jgi:hypothetical protein
MLGTLLVASHQEPLRSKAEMLVAVDLRLKGYFVFFPMGQQAPCDLIITWYDQPARRVEVKTAKLGKRGKPSPSGTEWYPDDHDIKAFVLPDQTVVYQPPVEAISHKGAYRGEQFSNRHQASRKKGTSAWPPTCSPP